MTLEHLLKEDITEIYDFIVEERDLVDKDLVHFWQNKYGWVELIFHGFKQREFDRTLFKSKLFNMWTRKQLENVWNYVWFRGYLDYDVISIVHELQSCIEKVNNIMLKNCVLFDNNNQILNRQIRYIMCKTLIDLGYLGEVRITNELLKKSIDNLYK